eukprot:scaffold60436_cov38-Phaeocystis_antarctica.AAC.1
MPGAPFGSTKSASSHTQHPTGHVAIVATGLSSPVNQRFAASSTARQQDRLTRRAHTSGGLVHARHRAERRGAPESGPSVRLFDGGALELLRRWLGRVVVGEASKTDW